MIRIITSLAILAAAIALALPAQAGSLTRSFVSSSGVDSNPCTIPQPCATFAAAYAAVEANGIVAALDPGKYGSLANITTGVTINGNGWSAITAQANGNGITINAGSANVTLIGLEIDGAYAAYNGIVVNSAGSLTVTNCTLQKFTLDNNDDVTTGNGILIQPTSGTIDFIITDTTVSHGGNTGIYYLPPSGSPGANGVIDHVAAASNTKGIQIDASGTSGGTTIVTVSNSSVSGNNVGVFFDASSQSTVKASIDHVSITGNSAGIYVNDAANVLLGRSVITGNDNGVINDSANTFYTYGDNRINLNTTNMNTTLNTTISRQ
jgi:nitrous oxidase accessory protein NosD